MDFNQFLTTGLVAAIVSSAFGFASTTLTLRAQKRAELRKRNVDRYDRLYAKIKAVQQEILHRPIPSPKSEDFDDVREGWVQLTQTLKAWYDTYSSCSELFDTDIRERVDKAAHEYDAAYAVFRSNPSQDGVTSRVLAAAESALEIIPAAANEQLGRLSKL
jgi:hypothetical protein